jgi:hypothetical protein
MAHRLSATICDDIRREDSGKFILIGAYIGNLGVLEFPVDERFCCLLKVDGLTKDAKKLALVMRHVGYPADTRDYDISDNNSGSLIMSIAGIPLKAKQPGNFYVEVSIDGGRRRKIERLAIVDAPELD